MFANAYSIFFIGYNEGEWALFNITGGSAGKWICQCLDQIGIHQQFLEIKEESRVCLNIVSKQEDTQTELLEPGPVVLPEEWEQMKDKFSELAKKSELMVLSGSLPKGLHTNAYKELIQISRQFRTKVIMDTSGLPLADAIDAVPYMIKPNREELEMLLHKKDMDEEDILQAMKQYAKRGIALIVVSLGKEGSLIYYRGNCYKASPPEVEIINPVGCGDALVAGIATGLYLELPIEDTIILGTAVSTACAMEVKAGYVNKDRIEIFKKQVMLEKLNV